MSIPAAITLYLDDHTMAFEKGGYLRQQLTCTAAADGSLSLHFAARQGSYKPWWKQITVTVHGWYGAAHATLGGKALQGTTDAAADTATISIPDQPHVMTLSLTNR